MYRALLVISTVVLLLSGLAMARDVEHATERVDVEGAKELEINIEFAAGTFELRSEDQKEAAVVNIDYNPRRVAYEIDYRVKGGTGLLDMESIQKRKRNIDTDDNRWEVVLSTRYPATLDIDVGACDAEIDLGGVPLKELSLDIGAASGEITFSEPNPERMERMDIDAGAASLECNMLGNANFEMFTFDGGAGSFDLDFRGEYSGRCSINIDIGLGSADITLPKGVPIRVETSGNGWLSSIDFHHDDLDQVDDDVYESPDFEGAKTRIVLEIDVGLGSVDVYFKK